EWRLRAYRNWLKMPDPHWANVQYGPIDYQAISYYAAPKQRPKLDSLEQVDPKLLETFEKLGIPIEERKRLAGVAVDAVFDSVSVATTFREELKKHGVIFCAISEAIREYPELVQQYVGSVVPYNDNFFAALNSAVFTDGSFVYVPKGVRCPMELSTYFRINAESTGQFERTLIVADAGSHVSYLEGCSAPVRDANQLHAAVVELVALDHRLEGYLGVPRPEHLPRASEDPQGRQAGPQLLAVRLHADRRQVRRAYLPVHRRAQQHRHHGARGVDLEDRRGPDLLREAA